MTPIGLVDLVLAIKEGNYDDINKTVNINGRNYKANEMTILVNSDDAFSSVYGNEQTIEDAIARIEAIESKETKFHIIDGLGKNWGTSTNQDLSNWANLQNIMECYGFATWINGGYQNVGTYRNIISTGEITHADAILQIGQILNETGATINAGAEIEAEVCIIEQTETSQELYTSFRVKTIYKGDAWTNGQLSNQAYMHEFTCGKTELEKAISKATNCGISVILTTVGLRKVRRMAQLEITGYTVIDE